MNKKIIFSLFFQRTFFLKRLNNFYTTENLSVTTDYAPNNKQGYSLTMSLYIQIFKTYPVIFLTLIKMILKDYI